ncbi:MAG: DUF748 domain-containing protein [Alistipes sp.]
MTKSIKILLITLATLVVLILAAALLISPITKSYIVKHSKELTGRQINIDELRMNVFTGELHIANIRMLEPNDSTTFAAIGEYNMSLRLLPLLSRHVAIEQITIVQPDVKIYQTGEHFNFDDLLIRFLADTTEVESTDEPWEVGIDDIKITGGNVFYKDMEIGATWEFKDLSASIPGIYFKDKTDVDVRVDFAQGGSLGLKMNYNMDNTAYDLHIDLRELALNGRLPYVQQMLNVGNMEGLFSAKLHMNGSLQNLFDIYFNGDMDLAHFTLDDTHGQEVMRVDSLHVGLTRGSLRHNQFHFNRLYLLGMSGKFEIYKDGSTNIAALIKPQTTPQTSVSTADSIATEPLDLRIEDIEVAQGVVHFKDLSHIRPFEYRLSNIRMKSRFDMNKVNRIGIDAQVQKTGKATIRWEGSMSNMDNHNILIMLTNIDLHDFSPYCEHYTAYPLTHGNFSFRSQNIIKNRQLMGTNHLDMFEPKADKKIKTIKPEFKIPLKLGLYVLKDKKGHVKIDLPVKGSIDNPDFSYRKIVMKALGNVLLKVITAPFSFLTGNNDNLEYIAIEPLQWEFTSEQYAKFDKLADMLREKPEMKITLTQRINYGKALQQQAENNLKMDFYNHQRQADTTAEYTPLTMLEYEKIEGLNLKSDEITLHADSLLRAQGCDPSKLNTAEKAMTLFATRATEQLAKMLERRNAAIVNYMTTLQGIPTTALHVATMTADALHTYTGKNRYTLGLEVEGETAEVAESVDDVAAQQQAMGLASEPTAPAIK